MRSLSGLYGSVAGLMVCLLCGVAHAGPTTLTSGIRITGNTSIKADTYRLADAGNGIVQISGSNFTVDFQGAKLVGPGTKLGIGIAIKDARNVTIKNAIVSDCLWGIVIERSVGVKLIACTTSWNADLKPGTVIDESGSGPEDTHGGGILLRDSRDCRVQRCISQHQWDGIDVVRSQHNIIEDGDYSYNGNWGIHLWDSSNNTFRRNRAIWCTTGGGMLYQALTGWQTYDAQAVGIDHNSNENLIEENDLRFGGDAIFIRANEGPITPGTVVPPRNGSHRNILRNNDCSFSPNNAIEVDLVDDTIIEGNNCSFSNYGLWLGYSRRCIVRNNICINDSTHAVEIENGQDDLFENNIFGWDTPRPNGQLIYLRQNGREKTPSGPYTLKHNVFYGAGTALQLTNTTAELVGNILLNKGWQYASDGNVNIKSFVADPSSHVTAREVSRPELKNAPYIPLVDIAPGAMITPGAGIHRSEGLPLLMEIEGIPLWERAWKSGTPAFWMPADFWDRPSKNNPHARRMNGVERGEAPLEGREGGTYLGIRWPANQSRIYDITPNPARIGDTVTVEGTKLEGGQFLLNGKPAKITSVTGNNYKLQLPDGILVPTSYNLVWQKGEGMESARTWPISFSVLVPNQQLPHLTSASFSPTTLHVGDLLKVTMTVRNNLPTPAPLTTKPAPNFTYEEKQASYEMGLGETAGKLHLRVSTDFRVGGHDPGSWPWLFGFEKDSLPPGETVTVVGYIKVETPGVHEFRIGLVAGGFRFIDDNAYRTKITVLP